MPEPTQPPPEPAGSPTDPPAAAIAGHRSRLARLDAPVAASGMLSAITVLDLALLVFGLAVYALTRFWALEQYPIYFFSDEAVHPNLAARLMANGLRDHVGTLLPSYFQNDERWNLSLSVYLHLITVAAFGKSVVVARATSAAVSLLGVLAAALALKVGFQSRVWWSAVLVLAALPVWFLHSRTAFEVVLMVSFYACFLCAYLAYRYRSPGFLYPTLIFGAATFYSYANGPLVMLITGSLLLLSDLRFHLRQPHRHQLAALALALLLVLPFLRFRWLHPEAVANQLELVNSYWLRDLPLAEKVAIFGRNYWDGISPAFWFRPNDVDLVRHLMDGLGHMPVFLLPFFLIGLGLCLWNWRSPAHRAVLAALLAAPAAALLATVYVTRGMAILVPATLLICLGLGWIVEGLGWQAGRRLGWRWAVPTLAIALAALLGLWNLYLLRTALVDGPTWSTNYSLHGMQYGAAQVFGAIGEEMRADPDLRVHMSPDWTNNAGGLAGFFLEPEQLPRLSMGNLNGLLLIEGELHPERLHVLTAEEYERAQTSPKLLLQPPTRVIPYPDGRPGFYFLHMRYADDIDAQFAADRAAMQKTVAGQVVLDGETVAARHSVLDLGLLEDLFDGNPETFVRGATANPLVLEFTFPKPRTIEGIKLHTSDMDLALKVTARPAGGGAPRIAETVSRDLPDEPRLDLPLPGGPLEVEMLRVEITDLSEPIEPHIHVRELGLR